jgi:hypothetical protein
MAHLVLDDDSGWVTAEIEVHGPVLGAALEHKDAEPIVRCAIMMALSALAADEAWPTELMQTMARFMSSMRHTVNSAALM